MPYKPWKVFHVLQETNLSLHGNPSLQEVVDDVEQQSTGNQAMRLNNKKSSKIPKCAIIEMIWDSDMDTEQSNIDVSR